MKPLRNLLALLLLGSAALLAQTAEITGRVTDPTNAVITGATVVVANEGTQVERRTVTTDAGYFVVTQLPPGNYRLTVEAPGFASQTQTGIRLAVQQSARLDFTLKVGSVAESVEVNASAALLESSNATIGYVIENKRVVDLPLKGRQFIEFALLGPGVNGGRAGDPRSSQQGIAISANGLYTKSNNFLLDGADNNESYQNQFAISPSVDAVEEFKVQTGLYPAEYGRGGGAVVSIVTKSGTNELHGVLFEFLRNDAVDARNFFAQSKTPLRRNQFGASLGGPIRHNSTFFFLNYDGTRQHRRSISNIIVPTEVQRGGDLSAFTTAIKDPYNNAAPFPGNIIPAGRITTVAKNLLAYYPLPNMPAGSRNNYYSSQAATTSPNFGVIKIDHRFSDRDSIYGRYAINDTSTFSPGAIPLAGGSRASEGAHGATLNWTHLLSATRLNVLAVSYNRFIQDAVGQNNGTPVAANAGILGVSTNPRDVGFPESVGFSAGTGFVTVGEGSTRLRRMNTYQVQDSMTISSGAHTVKFGGEIRRVQANVLQTSALQGTFTFNGQYTGGNGFAEYLMGIPSATQTSLNAGVVYPRRQSYALFAQDDWKATPNLTVNAGLRWELNMPVTDARGQLSAFDHSTGEIVFPANANLGTFYTSTRPDIKYRKFNSNSLYDPDYRNWGPRLGLAWRPFGTSKTVLRAGSGFFFLSPEMNSEQNTGNSPPFQLRIDNTGNAGVPNLSWNLGGDTSSLKTAQFGIFTMNAARNFRNGRVMEWMAEVQRELSSTWVAKVSYVGNKGVALDSHLVRNQKAPGPGAATTRRIFPLFARIRSYESDGWSNYHSLQATIEKRLSHGLTYFSSYTFAKNMDFGWTQDICCQQDIDNLAAENALSSQNQKHRFTANGLYELPFGPGKLGGNSGVLVSKLLEGWRLGAMVTLASGLPSNPSVSGNPDNVPDNTDRPNRIGRGNVDNPTIDRWWDKTAFAKQAAYTFGNSGRNVLTAPGARSGNLVASKNTSFGEVRRLEFRAEFFNFTNTPSWGAPSTTDVTNPNFGKIFSASSPREMQFGLKFYF